MYVIHQARDEHPFDEERLPPLGDVKCAGAMGPFRERSRSCDRPADIFVGPAEQMNMKGLVLLRWLKKTMHDLHVAEYALQEAMLVSQDGSWPLGELVAQCTAQELAINRRALQRAIDDVLAVGVGLDAIAR